MNNVSKVLTKAMNKLADATGKPIVFAGAVILLIGWFTVSRFLEYDIWLDIMDITIFIVTFLMLFVVQASQNADTLAIQDKLDKILDALPQADTKAKGEEKQLKRGTRKKPN